MFLSGSRHGLGAIQHRSKTRYISTNIEQLRAGIATNKKEKGLCSSGDIVAGNPEPVTQQHLQTVGRIDIVPGHH